MLILLGFNAAAIIIYNGRGWVLLNEIFRILLIEYLAIFLLAGILVGGLWVARRIRKNVAQKDRKPPYPAV